MRCFGIVTYPPDDPRHWLGRGNENVPGKPFGWAHNMERDAIRAHLRRRIWKFGLDGMAAARLEFRVIRIQERLRKYQPSWAERQAIWRAKQAPAAAPEGFTADELEMIAVRFAGANDPAGQGIAAKAAALQRRVTR